MNSLHRYCAVALTTLGLLMSAGPAVAAMTAPYPRPEPIAPVKPITRGQFKRECRKAGGKPTITNHSDGTWTGICVYPRTHA
jgi:hypothetical protein